MRRNTPVGNIMTPKVVVANLKSKLSQIQELFIRFNVHHVPVVNDDQKLVGIISSTDVMEFYAKKLKEIDRHDKDTLDAIYRVEEEMTKNPTTIEAHEPLTKALQLLAQGRFQSLPVMEYGELTGIITNKDFVTYFHQQFEEDEFLFE